jgi:hypothetical protein
MKEEPLDQSDDEEAFEAYWQRLLAASPALRSLRDQDRVRGLALADFRAAQADAFQAGRHSIL